MSFIKMIVQLLNREIPTSILIKKGLRCGKNFSRQQGCFIDPSHCWLISIGDNVTFSLRVTVLSHDASTKAVNGYVKIGKVSIGDNVFVGANSMILPGVTIGNNCVIGAGSVVTKNIPQNSVVAGNPARIIYTVDEWKSKIDSLAQHSRFFSEDYTERGGITKEKKEEMIDELKDGIAFVK